jgi:hypothetical protein
MRNEREQGKPVRGNFGAAESTASKVNGCSWRKKSKTNRYVERHRTLERSATIMSRILVLLLTVEDSSE